MPQLNAGDELGPLRIIRLLGSGGMADVYEAEDTRLGRRVAVKVLPQEYSRNQDFITRFEREVKASAALSHSNIVTVFEFGSIDGLNYYTMRLLPGGDLRARIAAGMSIVEILRTLRGVLQAFQHAHARGFVHRDVKPENVMFDDQGTPILTDFGIAKALDSHTRMTQTGMAVGTPRYISPEQAMGKDVDGRSDLYSLGCILYEMLTGNVPYKADTPIATIFQHVNEPVPTLDDEFSTFRELLEKLMAKNPDDRFQDATTALGALDRCFPSDWTGSFTASRLPVVGASGGGSGTPAATPIHPQKAKTPPSGPAADPQSDAATQLLANPVVTGGAKTDATQVLQPSAADAAHAATQIVPRPRAERTQSADAPVEPQKTSGSGWILGLILLLILIGAGLVWHYWPSADAPGTVDPVPVLPTAPESPAERAPAETPAESATDDEQRAAEAQRKAAAAEAERKRQAEAEARRKAAAEEAERKRQAEAAEARRRAAEQERLRQEREAAEARRKAAAEEAERKRQAEAAEARRRATEQERLRQEQEAAAERQRKAQQSTPVPSPAATPSAAEQAEQEAIRRRAREAELQRQREAEERRQREAAERRRRDELEAERLQREEAARQQALEDQRRQEAEAEAARQAEEDERKEKLKRPVPIGF